MARRCWCFGRGSNLGIISDLVCCARGIAIMNNTTKTSSKTSSRIRHLRKPRRAHGIKSIKDANIEIPARFAPPTYIHVEGGKYVFFFDGNVPVYQGLVEDMCHYPNPFSMIPWWFFAFLLAITPWVLCLWMLANA